MTKETTTVVIAAAADGKYALPLAVMLRSAADKLRPFARIDAYVVDDGISAIDREKVETSMPVNVALHWINRPRNGFDGLPSWGRMSLTTYHKLTLGEWLPADGDTAIWLDVDTLVLRDLALLWETDLADQIALAGQDAGVRFVSSRFGVAAHREIGIPPETRYFNA